MSISLTMTHTLSGVEAVRQIPHFRNQKSVASSSLQTEQWRWCQTTVGQPTIGTRTRHADSTGQPLASSPRPWWMQPPPPSSLGQPFGRLPTSRCAQPPGVVVSPPHGARSRLGCRCQPTSVRASTRCRCQPTSVRAPTTGEAACPRHALPPSTQWLK